jgi:hypothetical protein
MTVYLDSMIVIDLVEGPDPLRVRARDRMAQLVAAGDRAAVSDLTPARLRAGRQTQPSANGKPRAPRRGRTRKVETERPLFTRIEGASAGGEP